MQRERRPLRILIRDPLSVSDRGLRQRRSPQAEVDLLQEFGDQAAPIYWAAFRVRNSASTRTLPVLRTKPRMVQKLDCAVPVNAAI